MGEIWEIWEGKIWGHNTYFPAPILSAGVHQASATTQIQEQSVEGIAKLPIQSFPRGFWRKLEL
jgi:hypothetical protein